MTFVKVGDLLAKRRPLPREDRQVIDAMVVVGAWQSVLKDIRCVEKFERTRALAFNHGTLSVLANSSAAASELRLCQQKIIDAYTKRFKTNVVQKLVIRRQ